MGQLNINTSAQLVRLKRNSSKPGIRTQSGVTLINLLIGLLLSTIGSLAALQLYSNLVFVSTDIKEDAMHDGQLATSLLTIQRIITDAGFGISNAGLDHLTRVSTPATATAPATLSLLWRFDDGTATRCRGLLEDSATRGNKDYRSLSIIESVTDCAIDVPLTDMLWPNTLRVVEQWKVTPELADYLTANGTLLDIQLGTSICSPFGTLTSAPHASITVTAPTSAHLHGLNDSPGVVAVPHTSNVYCLPNIYP